MKKINNNIKFLYVIIICFLFIKFLSAINIIPMITIVEPIIWFIIFIIGIFITHLDYNHFFSVKDKKETMIIILIIYLIIHFSLGLFFGYSYNIYNNSKFIYVLKNIYLYILPIIFQEYIRCVLCNYSSNNNKIKAIIAILFIFINLNFVSFSNIFINGEAFFKFLCMNLIPLISLEFVLTYLASIGGYKLNLLYKLLITIYSIFIPIVPNLNFFITGIINTVFPVVVYLYVDQIHEMDTTRVYRDNSKKSLLNYIPVMLVGLIVILNFFGVFKYGVIAILSNSMNPLYYKGDSIVYKKLNNNEKELLKEGDIIVFENKDGDTIIHRIENIKEQENKSFITKGDNNENIDTEVVTYNKIKGKYLFHIKYLGYFKLFMYESLNN